MKSSILALFTVCATGLAGCGGGGGGGGGGKSLRLEMAFDRSGRVFSDGLVQNTMTGGLFAGDFSDNRSLRAMMSIVLAQIPAGANIAKATLTFEGELVAGQPYAEFGDLVVDHINIGAGFDGSDFSGGVLTASYRTVPPFGNTAPYSLDVTSAVVADVTAGRLTSSFRFQFNLAPSLDNANDYVFITSGLSIPLLGPHIDLEYD